MGCDHWKIRHICATLRTFARASFPCWSCLVCQGIAGASSTGQQPTGSSTPSCMYRCAQVLTNIVDCGNTVEKFRRLRVSNGKFHDGVWCKPGGSEVGAAYQSYRRSAPVTFCQHSKCCSSRVREGVDARRAWRWKGSGMPCTMGLQVLDAAAAQVMHVAGFRIVGDALELPSDASLPALTCLLASLRRIVSQRGHSGDAEFFPLPGSRAEGAAGSSPYLVSPLLALLLRAVLCLSCHDSMPTKKLTLEQALQSKLHELFCSNARGCDLDMRLRAEHAWVPVSDRHPPLHPVRPSYQRRQRAPVHRVL